MLTLWRPQNISRLKPWRRRTILVDPAGRNTKHIYTIHPHVPVIRPNHSYHFTFSTAMLDRVLDLVSRLLCLALLFGTLQSY